MLHVLDESRATRECLEKELSCLRKKRDETLGRMNNKRYLLSFPNSYCEILL